MRASAWGSFHAAWPQGPPPPCEVGLPFPQRTSVGAPARVGRRASWLREQLMATETHVSDRRIKEPSISEGLPSWSWGCLGPGPRPIGLPHPCPRRSESHTGPLGSEVADSLVVAGVPVLAPRVHGPGPRATARLQEQPGGSHRSTCQPVASMTRLGHHDPREPAPEPASPSRPWAWLPGAHPDLGLPYMLTTGQELWFPHPEDH